MKEKESVKNVLDLNSEKNQLTSLLSSKTIDSIQELISKDSSESPIFSIHFGEDKHSIDRFQGKLFQILSNLTCLLILEINTVWENISNKEPYDLNFFKHILENIDVDLAIFDVDGNYRWVNPKAVSNPEVRKWMIGKNDFDFVEERSYPLEIAKQRQKNIKKAVKTGRQQEFEEQITTENNDKKYIVRRIYPVTNENTGDTNYLIGYGFDLTEKKKLQKELEQLLQVIEYAGNQVTILDKKGNIRYSNKQFKNKFNFSNHDDHPSLYDILISHEIEKGILKKIKSTILNDKDWSDELCLKINDSLRWFYVQIYPIHQSKPDNYQFTAIFEDVTERKLLEDERQRHQKFESLGVLAGGIAHDFNNYLTTIQGNVEIMEIMLNQNFKGNKKLKVEEFRTILNSIKKAYDQASSLTNQLISFSKGGKPSKKVIDIVSLIKETSNIFLRGTGIEPIIDTQDDEYFVKADENSLNQVISNLIINAVDAMKNNPDPKLVIQAFKHEDEFISLDDEYVQIEIEDNGVGIKQENLDKIFDPYYTNKNDGSGLGLSVVNSVIEKLNGHIFVQSVKDKGSKFVILLPLSKRKVDGLHTEEVTNTIKGDPKILILDDEKEIRNLLSEFLTKKNCRVRVAKTGDETLAKLKRAADNNIPFNLAILDITIKSGKGAFEIIDNIKSIDNNIKTIVYSGYTDFDETSDDKLSKFDARLNKPFSFNDLIKTINQII